MRNTDSSGKTSLTISLSSCAEARSCPKGFSMTTRRQASSVASASPERESCLHTVGNASGGIER